MASASFRPEPNELRADVIGLRVRCDNRRKLGISDCETEGDGEEHATLTVPLLMLERVVGAMEAHAPRVVVNPWDGCFDAAMQAVLCGGRASRRDWNRPSHIEMRVVEGFSNGVIVMVMRDGTVGPYTPSGCDMVASDWEALENSPAGLADAHSKSPSRAAMPKEANDAN